jgi:hypothetical protein
MDFVSAILSLRGLPGWIHLGLCNGGYWEVDDDLLSDVSWLIVLLAHN